MVKADSGCNEQLWRRAVGCRGIRHRLYDQQCQQMYSGVPGFGFIIARKSELQYCKGVSKSLSLDIYDQWDAMEKGHGKWRFTSPTHVVRAFKQAMDELAAEGGVEARHARYCRNHDVLVEGMRSLGFKTLLKDEVQSPVITSFLYPDKEFDFKEFYHQLKEKGFVIYPGKISRGRYFPHRKHR